MSLPTCYFAPPPVIMPISRYHVFQSPSPALTLMKMNWAAHCSKSTASFSTRHLIARSWTSITSPNARECGPLLQVVRVETAMLLLGSPWQAGSNARGYSSGGIHWAPRQPPCAAGSWLNAQERHGPRGCHPRQDHITRSEETMFGHPRAWRFCQRCPDLRGDDILDCRQRGRARGISRK